MLHYLIGGFAVVGLSVKCELCPYLCRQWLCRIGEHVCSQALAEDRDRLHVIVCDVVRVLRIHDRYQIVIIMRYRGNIA